jgi:hypothetical protein
VILKKVGMSVIHEISKRPEFRDKLKRQLLAAFKSRLEGAINRIADLDDFFFVRKEYDVYLDEARWSYFYGYFIASINLSCVCAERMLIDLFMDATIVVNGHSLSAEEKEKTFSGQLQARRIKIAHSTGLIDMATFKSFQELDKFRQKYIHPNKPIDQYNIAEDAKKAILRLHNIVRACFPFLIDPIEEKKLKKEIIDRFVQDEI